MGLKFRVLLISPFYYNPEKSEIKGSLEGLKRCQKDGMEVPLYV